ncbi:MAG: M23 family metallopeptidase [Brevefilum sp.]
MKILLILMAALLISGCQAAESTPTWPSSTPTPAPTATYTPTVTETPSPTFIPPTPSVTPSQFTVCSPLEEETFESLPLILVNPLRIPPIGKDSGHHGLDYAYFRRGERESIQGIEVYALLSGRTVLTLEDVIPYGYTILIETPLDQIPEQLQEKLLAAYQPIPDTVVYQGECPAFETPINTGEMSVYHLYAHLEEQPPFQPGDSIACGENLGTVGNSGRSSNPHLHLETRLGPSGAAFTNMAFYEATYSEQQRANYCLWRMSGHYQLFDPSHLWEALD